MTKLREPTVIYPYPIGSPTPVSVVMLHVPIDSYAFQVCEEMYKEWKEKVRKEEEKDGKRHEV